MFVRGQKWNPLRKRLDSYDYTVKQHIVGSLLFTPLLLLLPTTSVFYIFFSILDTTISLICMLIGVTISVIHATPYAEVLLRLIRPKRFPSGIWFEIVSCQNDTNDSSEGVNSSSENLQMKDIANEKTSSMVSFLRSNCMTLGETFLFTLRRVYLFPCCFFSQKVFFNISACWEWEAWGGQIQTNHIIPNLDLKSLMLIGLDRLTMIMQKSN